MANPAGQCRTPFGTSGSAQAEVATARAAAAFVTVTTAGNVKWN